jgi:hypothetical protein
MPLTLCFTSYWKVTIADLRPLWQNVYVAEHYVMAKYLCALKEGGDSVTRERRRACADTVLTLTDLSPQSYVLGSIEMPDFEN